MTVNDPIPSNALLVDLRDREDFAAGHLPGARHMTLEEVQEEADPGTPICLYCYRGMRSLTASLQLKAAGFHDVRNLGGISAYRGELVR